ncbi:MAG: hypothetical protein AB7H66_16225 [Hyphomonadaceae bacterium]
MRSSSLTQAQEQELNQRLSSLQSRFDALSLETRLQARAIRNLAVEQFGARPNLSFDAHVQVIEDGARELRTYLDEARSRVESNATVASMRQEVVSLAEQGRVFEARAAQNQLLQNASATQRDAQQRTADIRETARLASISTDYYAAAARYLEAARLQPIGSHDRWAYTSAAAESLVDAGRATNDRDALHEGIRLLEQEVLPLAPQASAPNNWATTEVQIGNAYTLLADRGDLAAIPRAVAAYEAAITVWTRERDPAAWSFVQQNLSNVLTRAGPQSMHSAVSSAEAAVAEAARPGRDRTLWALAQISLGTALLNLADQGNDPSVYSRAIQAFQAALSVLSPSAFSNDWADAQVLLGIARFSQWRSGQGDESSLSQSVTALQAGLGAMSQPDPQDLHQMGRWAHAQVSLGDALWQLWAMGLDDSAISRAYAAYQAAAQHAPRELDPNMWARAYFGLGKVLATLAFHGSSGASEQAIRAFEATMSVWTRERNARMWAATQLELARVHRDRARQGYLGSRGPGLAAARSALSAFQHLPDGYVGVRQAEQEIATMEALPIQ